MFTDFSWYQNGELVTKRFPTHSVIAYRNAVAKIESVCDDINDIRATTVN